MRTQPSFYSRVFSLVVAAILGYALWRIFEPLLNAMSWAMFLAFLLHPVNLRLRRRLHGTVRAAGVLIVLTPIVILLPLSALSFAFVTEASALVRTVQQRARELDIKSFSDLQQFPFIARANSWVQAHGGISADQVQSWVVSATQDVLQRAAGLSGWFFLGAVGSVIGFSLMLFLLFFFLRDGDALCERARGLIPLDEERKDRLFAQLSDVARAIVLGTTLTAVIQGVLVGIGMAICGLPSPVVFGVLVALLAMLPMGGAVIVWLPAVGWLLYEGRWGYAIFMLAWGLMIMGLENVLRPILISGRARISALSIFVGVLGGISAFGTIGIVVGPVVLSLVLALIEFTEEISATTSRSGTASHSGAASPTLRDDRPIDPIATSHDDRPAEPLATRRHPAD